MWEAQRELLSGNLKLDARNMKGIQFTGERKYTTKDKKYDELDKLMNLKKV